MRASNPPSAPQEFERRSLRRRPGAAVSRRPRPSRTALVEQRRGCRNCPSRDPVDLGQRRADQPVTGRRARLVQWRDRRIALQGRSLRGPVWITPGQAARSVTCTSATVVAAPARSAPVRDLMPMRCEARPRRGDRGAAGPDHRRALRARRHAAALSDGGPGVLRVGTLADFESNPRFATAHERYPEKPPEPLPGLSAGGVRLGTEHRSERLHRLQGLHHCLPGREQHSRRRQGPGPARDGRCTGSGSIGITKAIRTIRTPTRSPCPA